jgi:cell shape-determining protein MreD
MHVNTLLEKKIRSSLMWLILPLSVIALLTELAPEIEAKIIVAPTLILMIALCMLELSERWSNTRQNYKMRFKSWLQ